LPIVALLIDFCDESNAKAKRGKKIVEVFWADGNPTAKV